MDGISEPSKSSSWAFLPSNALTSRAADLINSFQLRREALGLPNPGNGDNISKEVDRDVFLNNSTFTGLRADITKAVSFSNPIFQITHAFSMGSQSQPPYNFGVVYGSPKAFMQATLDNDKSLFAKFNWRWNKALVTRTQISTGGDQSAVMLDNEYVGNDFTASIKAQNPSLLQGGLTGTVVGEYLQSVTPKLSLGLNATWNRSAMEDGPQMMLSYMARYKTPMWIASTRILPQMGMQVSYWRRLAERVEAGADVNLSFMDPMGGSVMGGQPKLEGLAQVGAKCDFRMATFRAQLDSKGRMSTLLEKRLHAPVTFSFVGQIDHVKNEAKVGFGVSIESHAPGVAEHMAAMGEPTETIQPPF